MNDELSQCSQTARDLFIGQKPYWLQSELGLIARMRVDSAWRYGRAEMSLHAPYACEPEGTG